MTDWSDLARECDAWRVAGRKVELWWRDDDAIADTPQLRRLVALTHVPRLHVPLALAVIPAGLEPSLAALLADRDGVNALQHGFDHRNRAAAGAKKSELPADRPWEEIAADLARGRDRLVNQFGDRFVPALTPPWNRIAPAHAARLPELGYRGLTMYLARRRGAAPLQVNTHVDVIDWHGTRGFVGLGPALDLLIGHLSAKRLGTADPAEPTGLLTHHLVHDTETWEFLGALLDWSADKPNIQWRSAADLFPESGDQ